MAFKFSSTAGHLNFCTVKVAPENVRISNRLEIRPVPQTFFRLESGKLEAAITVSRQRMTDLFEEKNSTS